MKDGPSKTLGILLARNPESTEALLVRDLARGAVERGIRILLFVMAEGADLLCSPMLSELTALGVRVSACTQSVTERALPLDLEEVDYSSQFQLGRMVALADRFVSFT